MIETIEYCEYCRRQTRHKKLRTLLSELKVCLACHKTTKTPLNLYDSSNQKEKMKKLITYSAIILLSILAVSGWQWANSLSQELASNRAILQDWEQIIQNQQKVIDDYNKHAIEFMGKNISKQAELIFLADYWQGQYDELKSNPVIKEVYLDRPVDRIVFPELSVFEEIEDVPKYSFIAWEVDGQSAGICLWVAQQIQLSLLNQGYIASIAVAWNGYYDGIYVTDAPGAHAGLLAETKQGWYFIDPEVWKITRLF